MNRYSVAVVCIVVGALMAVFGKGDGWAWLTVFGVLIAL